MGDVLYSFEPDLNDTTMTLWLSLFVALAAVGGAVTLMRSKAASGDRRYRMLGAMLLFFVFLISASTAFFSFWSRQKIDTIYIYEDAIETPYGRIEFANLKDAGIEIQRDPSLVNPSMTRSSSRVLIIEEETGKKHILSEDNYDLQDLMRKLRQAVQNYRSREKQNGLRRGPDDDDSLLSRLLELNSMT